MTVTVADIPTDPVSCFRVWGTDAIIVYLSNDKDSGIKSGICSAAITVIRLGKALEAFDSNDALENEKSLDKVRSWVAVQLNALARGKGERAGKVSEIERLPDLSYQLSWKVLEYNLPGLDRDI